MKERPILYSTPMVQAKLAGRKTQTRRIIKESFNGCLTNGGPHPCPNEPVVIYPGETYESPCNPGETIFIDSPEVRAVFHCSTLDSVAKCRYGKVGDILWARETWSYSYYWECYKAAGIGPFDTKLPIYAYKADSTEVNGWKPSIHMPKEAARIWERITNIRVERLQDISETDAIAEGIFKYGTFGEYAGSPHPNGGQMKYRAYGSPIDAYRCIWESINGPGSWELNPWVWVIESEILSTTGRPDLEKL